MSKNFTSVELTKSNDVRMKIHAGLILVNASPLRLSEVQREANTLTLFKMACIYFAHFQYYKLTVGEGNLKGNLMV